MCFRMQFNRLTLIVALNYTKVRRHKKYEKLKLDKMAKFGFSKHAQSTNLTIFVTGFYEIFIHV